MIGMKQMLEALVRNYPRETKHLAQIFKDSTTSYKYAWFLAIMAIINRDPSLETISLTKIFAEMVSIVWYPVCFFKLSLGIQDILQREILSIFENEKLQPDLNIAILREYVLSKQDIIEKMDFLKKYVPYRFLTPWFDKSLNGKKDHEKNNIIRTLANGSQNSEYPTPYFFDSAMENIIVNQCWKGFIFDNFQVIHSFAEYNFVQYLQSRNPNSPNVINKLHPPRERQLQAARNFWEAVRKEFLKAGNGHFFVDIYSGQQLDGKFSIDHFLPWSFLAHDLLWNLIPINKRTNSSKRDSIPELERYIPRLANLHYQGIHAIEERKFLEDYLINFKTEPNELLKKSKEEFESLYWETFVPQTQIAINQGFPHSWVYQENF